MARVLVTRPLEAAKRTARVAEGLGHDVVFAPVLTIRERALDGAPALDPPVQAALVTSRHAVSAVARHLGELPLFAVGDGTWRALRALGLEPVAQGAGDGASLAAVVAGRLDPADGPLLHPTGEVRAGGLQTALERAGFDYRPWVVYAAEPVTALPGDVCTLLAQGAVDAVTVHSPRSGRLFIERLHAAGLAHAVGGVVALALSENVARAVGALGWRKVRVAPSPDEAGMAALLEELRH